MVINHSNPSTLVVFQPSSQPYRWKDLNSKFVLQVYRDYALDPTRAMGFLRSCWPSVRLAIDYLLQFDVEGCGVPQNQGFPDQTYSYIVIMSIYGN